MPTSPIPASILVVDDNSSNLDALVDTLNSLGEPIVTARSGKLALKELMTASFAVILLDVNMPGMDGFETAALIRQSKKSMHTPIIFVTAYDDGQPEMLKAYTLGAVDYIVKPYVAEILRSKIQVFIDLYRLKEENIRQKEQEKGRAEEELQNALRSIERLQGWQEGTVTAQMAGIGPLRERSPDAFSDIQAEYESLLEKYLEALGYAEKPPRSGIRTLSFQIGALGGGPRDLIDIHLHVVSRISQNVPSAREKAYAMEGRLLALEAMGFLVDYYRSQHGR